MESVSSYTGLLEGFLEPSLPLLNGYVARQIHYSSATPVIQLSRQLAVQQHLCTEHDEAGVRRIAYAVKKLTIETKRLRRTGARDWNRLVEILYSPFFVQPMAQEDVHSTTMEAELLGERFVVGGNVSIIAGPSADVEQDPSESLVTEEVSTIESLSTSAEENLILNQGFVTSDVSMGVDDLHNETFSTGRILHVARLDEHNYCIGADHSVEMSSTTEGSNKSSQVKCYDLRGKRCSRCVIKNQAILQLKNVIKKLKLDLKTMKSLKVRNLTRSLQRKHVQVQSWKTKYMQEREKNLQSRQASVNVSSPQAGLDDRGKNLMIAKIKLSKLQKKFQVLTQQHLQDIHEWQSKYKSETAKLMEGHDRLVAENSKLLKEIDDLITEKNHFAAKMHSLEAENSKLIEDYDALVDASQDEEVTGIGKFDLKVRKVTYESLLKNVPVRNVGQLAEYIAEAVGKGTLKMPHYSSISRMAHEPGVLALIQVGEALQNLPDTEDLVISPAIGASDGATMEPATEDFVISTARVASGRAVDYAGHIISSMKEVASVYSDYTGLPFVEVLSMFKDKCTCSVTDRAAVNTCVLEMLQSELDMQLIQLKCNIHPLDSVATKARECCSDLDKRFKVQFSWRTCLIQGSPERERCGCWNICPLRWKSTSSVVSYGWGCYSVQELANRISCWKNNQSLHSTAC
ncbi:uncharacterized protein LOC131956245 isoform X2 [Physella acuta]|uniref:uncharacterized protein LOC131956245 isoform X2 n=1 Tax=Physella acuta TaxID=109671 RepID=UPI0027DC7992|nr:uncharacterized protein LOC131956245 isoform X2 [Physella acuta]